ncbi:MAG: hypothetical protein IPM54_20545 [Polyangiaceae bacterium]|nr:hypothetical protein [Polyangiaceae bacterium]
MLNFGPCYGMMQARKHLILAVAFGFLASAVGCELIAAVDRNEIPAPQHSVTVAGESSSSGEVALGGGGFGGTGGAGGAGGAAGAGGGGQIGGMGGAGGSDGGT